MSVWYSLCGGITVNNGPAVQEILERFDDEGGEIGVIGEIENTDGTLTIIIGGGDLMSYTAAEQLDSILQELGPYATEPTYITYECDNENGFLYIGPPDREGDYRSREALREIKSLVGDLNENDRNRLIDHLHS